MNEELKELEKSEEKKGFKWTNLEQVFEIINIQHSRITKAIEYIENECLDDTYNYCHDLCGNDIFEVLDILKGSDKE